MREDLLFFLVFTEKSAQPSILTYAEMDVCSMSIKKKAFRKALGKSGV